MRADYEHATSLVITDKQLMKKINNMKNVVKLKSDLTKTGNKPLILKNWEKTLLDLLPVQHSPVFNAVVGKRDFKQRIRLKNKTIKFYVHCTCTEVHYIVTCNSCTVF